MIMLEDVTHGVRRFEKPLSVLRNATFAFDRRRIGLLGGREDQAEAIVDLLAGYMLPDTGRIRRFGRVSWPIGRLLQFRSELSGHDTVLFLAQLYGLDARATEHFLHEIVDFGVHYNRPVADWPRLLGVEFAHAAVLLPEFDIYLAEGSIVVGDEAFMQRWRPHFEARLASGQLIMSCNQAAYMSQFCRSVAVVRNGELIGYSDVASAFDAVAWSVADSSQANNDGKLSDEPYEDGIA